MKLIHQIIQVVSCASILASSAFVPQRKDGVYHYHPDQDKHVRVGPIQKATGKVQVPIPSSSKSKSGRPKSANSNSRPNARKVLRSLDSLIEESEIVDYDLFVRALLEHYNEGEEDFLESRFHDDDLQRNLLGRAQQTIQPMVSHRPFPEKPPSALTPATLITPTTPHAASTPTPKGQGFSASKTECKNEIVSAQDFAAAYESLAIACGKGYDIAHGQHIYAVSGSAVVYTCSFKGWWGGDHNPCKATEMWTAFTTIQDKCPDYRVGYAKDDKSQKSYGLELVGAPICK